MAEAAKTAPKSAPTPAAGGATGEAAPKPAAKAAKPKAEPKPPRYNPKGTVVMLADKDGKKYGPDHNPKRAGTKAATWFANYKDGITIADLEEAYKKTGGSMNQNLDWDIKHKFVEYKAPTA